MIRGIFKTKSVSRSLHRTLSSVAPLVDTEQATAKVPIADVTLSDVTAAAFRIKDKVVYTTCNESLRLSELFGMQIFTKAEYQQRTGSFKERGAANVISQLSPEQKKQGIGNFYFHILISH